MKVLQWIQSPRVRLRVRGKKKKAHRGKNTVKLGSGGFSSPGGIRARGAGNLGAELKMEVRACVWPESAAVKVGDNRA